MTYQQPPFGQPQYQPYEQQYPPQFGQPTPPQPPKQWPRWPWFTGAAVSLVIVAVAIGAANSSHSGPTTANTAAAPSASATTAPDDMVAVPTDLVGKTVAAAEQELSNLGVTQTTLSGANGLQSLMSACAPSVSASACSQLQVSGVPQSGQQVDLTQGQKVELDVTQVIPPGGASSIVQDGTYVVGKDIVAGTWHTDGQSSDGSCYWEKDRDLNGDFNSIVANDNISGPTTLNISSSTVAFKVSGGCTWTKE